MRKWISLTFIVLTTFLFIFKPVHAATIDEVVVFGDSLSDNGNLLNLTTRLSEYLSWVKPIPISPPYFEGRFSNGKIWPEYLAESMQVDLADHAYGGSWAESIWSSGLTAPFDLESQVTFFYWYTDYDASNDNHLYIIWMGHNDYASDRADHEQATTNTIKVVREQMERLMSNGAQYIVVVNMPDLGKVPTVTRQGKEVAAKVSALCNLHNEKLKVMMEEEQEIHPDRKILLFNVNKEFTDVVDHPEKYHFKNSVDACYPGDFQTFMKYTDKREIQAAKKYNIDLENPSLKAAYVTAKLATAGYKPCKNADEYVFWDHMHPTSRVHQQIADGLLKWLAENDIHGAEKINS